MKSLEIEPRVRHESVARWIEELEEAAEDIDETKTSRNVAARRAGSDRC
jgi:hypothetical protein